MFGPSSADLLTSKSKCRFCTLEFSKFFQLIKHESSHAPPPVPPPPKETPSKTEIKPVKEDIVDQSSSDYKLSEHFDDENFEELFNIYLEETAKEKSSQNIKPKVRVEKRDDELEILERLRNYDWEKDAKKFYSTKINRTGFKCIRKRCGKCFESRWALFHHIMVHDNEKPYKCQFCDLAFNQAVYREKHEAEECSNNSALAITIAEKNHKNSVNEGTSSSILVAKNLNKVGKIDLLGCNENGHGTRAQQKTVQSLKTVKKSIKKKYNSSIKVRGLKNTDMNSSILDIAKVDKKAENLASDGTNEKGYGTRAQRNVQRLKTETAQNSISSINKFKTSSSIKAATSSTDATTTDVNISYSNDPKEAELLSQDKIKEFEWIQYFDKIPDGKNPSNFECKTCHKTMTHYSRRQLYSHKLAHDGLKFGCRFCPKTKTYTSSSFINRNHHESTQHNSNVQVGVKKRIKISTISYSNDPKETELISEDKIKDFDSAQYFDKIPDGKKTSNFRCKICQNFLQLYSRRQLYFHKLVDDGVKFGCLFCSTTFTSFISRDKHESTHSDIKIRLEKLRKSTKDRQTLAQIKKSYKKRGEKVGKSVGNSQKKYQNVIQSNRGNRSTRIKTENPPIIKINQNDAKLGNNSQASHSKKSLLGLCMNPNSSQKIECKFCKKVFNCKGNVLRHVKLHCTMVPTQIKKYIISRGINHIRNIKNMEKPFKCKFCSNYFGYSENLKRHQVNSCKGRNKQKNKNGDSNKSQDNEELMENSFCKGKNKQKKNGDSNKSQDNEGLLMENSSCKGKNKQKNVVSNKSQDNEELMENSCKSVKSDQQTLENGPNQEWELYGILVQTPGEKLKYQCLVCQKFVRSSRSLKIHNQINHRTSGADRPKLVEIKASPGSDTYKKEKISNSIPEVNEDNVVVRKNPRKSKFQDEKLGIENLLNDMIDQVVRNENINELEEPAVKVEIESKPKEMTKKSKVKIIACNNVSINIPRIEDNVYKMYQERLDIFKENFGIENLVHDKFEIELVEGVILSSGTDFDQQDIFTRSTRIKAENPPIIKIVQNDDKDAKLGNNFQASHSSSLGLCMNSDSNQKIECKFCKKTFNFKSNLLRHVKLNCTMVPAHIKKYIISRNINYTRYMKNMEKPFKCEFCSNYFGYYTNLKRHQISSCKGKKKQKSKNGDSNKSQDNEELMENSCKSVKSDRQSLENVPNQEWELYGIRVQNSGEKLKYQCLVCQKFVRSSWSLKIHNQINHGTSCADRPKLVEIKASPGSDSYEKEKISNSIPEVNENNAVVRKNPRKSKFQDEKLEIENLLNDMIDQVVRNENINGLEEPAVKVEIESKPKEMTKKSKVKIIVCNNVSINIPRIEDNVYKMYQRRLDIFKEKFEIENLVYDKIEIELVDGVILSSGTDLDQQDISTRTRISPSSNSNKNPDGLALGSDSEMNHQDFVFNTATYNWSKDGRTVEIPGRVEKYQCLICNLCLKDKMALFHHQSKHTGQKPYSCQKCGRKFTQPSSRKRHLEICILSNKENSGKILDSKFSNPRETKIETDYDENENKSLRGRKYENTDHDFIPQGIGLNNKLDRSETVQTRLKKRKLLSDPDLSDRNRNDKELVICLPKLNDKLYQEKMEELKKFCETSQCLGEIIDQIPENMDFEDFEPEENLYMRNSFESEIKIETDYQYDGNDDKRSIRKKYENTKYRDFVPQVQGTRNLAKTPNRTEVVNTRFKKRKLLSDPDFDDRNRNRNDQTCDYKKIVLCLPKLDEELYQEKLKELKKTCEIRKCLGENVKKVVSEENLHLRNSFERTLDSPCQSQEIYYK